MKDIREDLSLSFFGVWNLVIGYYLIHHACDI